MVGLWFESRIFFVSINSKFKKINHTNLQLFVGVEAWRRAGYFTTFFWKFVISAKQIKNQLKFSKKLLLIFKNVKISLILNQETPTKRSVRIGRILTHPSNANVIIEWSLYTSINIFLLLAFFFWRLSEIFYPIQDFLYISYCFVYFPICYFSRYFLINRVPRRPLFFARFPFLIVSR